MKAIVHGLNALLVCLGLGLTALPAAAQPSAAELLEQARARAREIEELKAVLNGPDQNMRLAVFEVMVASGDNATREIALDTALASTDPLLQAMAFKEVVLSMERLVLTLAIDTSQPQSTQDKAQQILASKGSAYDMPFEEVDKKTGSFLIKRFPGQVSGTTLTFKNGYDDGTLSLVDETTLQGPIRLYSGGYGGFIATARIR